MIELLVEPLIETIIMVFSSSLIALILGLPLGVGLILTDEGGLHENKIVYGILSGVVNLTRSIPFIILMILLFPLSRFIVGTTIGTTATIVPLALGATPFMGRLIESSLKEVEDGIIEAMHAMGATSFEIIRKALIPEALPSIVRGVTLLIINLISYSAMAGAIGGGGLGDLAIRYGYHRYQMDVLLASVIVIIILVQFIQVLGNRIANYLVNQR